MMVTLPKPSGGFRWAQLSPGPFGGSEGRPALVCDALEPCATHFFTTRAWRLGDASAPADTGWTEVAQAAHVDPARLTRLRQVHGAAAVVYREGGRADTMGPPEADIVLTDDPDRGLAVQTADCVPLLVVDRRTHAVAAAHAGWRGLASRVPAVTVERMAAAFGSAARDLLVAIGPAIGACCYEVGDDVRARFAAAGFSAAHLERWFAVDPAVSADNPPMPALASRRAGHWFLDCRQASRDQLESAGVPGDQILAAGLCTASQVGAFCSYRRDRTGAGRMAAVIGRPRFPDRGPSPR
jgi:purine-nucleoside/S-methyl-5'-thioadenosine phosphorylase / adenosine deaminase